MPSDPPPSPPPNPGPIAPPAGIASTPAADSAAVAANRLTPEEQMALFEKELKENDWGHQPC